MLILLPLPFFVNDFFSLLNQFFLGIEFAKYSRMKKLLFLKLLLGACLLTQATGCGQTTAGMPMMMGTGSPMISGVSTGTCVPLNSSIAFSVGGVAIGTNLSSSLLAGLIPRVSNNAQAGQSFGMAYLSQGGYGMGTAYGTGSWGQLQFSSLGISGLYPTSTGATTSVTVVGTFNLTQSALSAAYAAFGVMGSYSYGGYSPGLCAASLAFQGDIQMTGGIVKFWSGTNTLYLYVKNQSSAYNYSLSSGYSGYNTGFSSFQMPPGYTNALSGTYGLMYKF